MSRGSTVDYMWGQSSSNTFLTGEKPDDLSQVLRLKETANVIHETPAAACIFHLCIPAVFGISV